MQPHIRRGRFFNHAHERLVHRFGKEIKSLLHIAGKRLMKKAYRIIDYQTKPHDWIADLKPLAASQEPLVTWLGHATFLIQLNKINIITDPVFQEVSRFFPRITKLPIASDELPQIHVILISHNHRDHMDEQSLLALKKHQPLMLVPMGNKSWFIARGFEQVVEMGWWQEYELKSSAINFSFLPANHWTGRGLFDFNKTLWGSWMIQCGDFTLYFAGDTGYGEHFARIQERFSSINVALMPIGPNEPRSVMVHSHVSTQEAVQAFLDLHAQHFLPMHWGTFKSGFDAFADPINQLHHWWSNFQLAADRLHTLKFGEQWLFDSLKP
ncbi:MBL fold metallo-hydrolase [Candidatus Dependentiae bacterium]|nr:MBL fold metallo-hydrolase [Candidatus Dependentiae bacterium]